MPPFALMVVAMATITDTMTIEEEIRATRARSNASIAARDLAGMRAAFLPDATVLPGSSGAAFGMDGFDARVGASFSDPTFVTWIRTPTKIAVGTSGRRAAETGTWVGIWRKPDGEMRVTGVYQAMWLPTPNGWRLKNESFITLDCSGSKECAGIY